MKKVLAVIAVLAILLVGAVLALPSLVDLDGYKGQVADIVEQRTGRKLTMSGPIDLAVFPTLGIRIGDVGLSNAPGAGEPVMVSLQTLTVAVKLLPLLSGDVVVDRFVLERPVVHLEIDPKGKPNWEFAGAAGAPAAEGGGAAGERQQGGTGLGDVNLGEVRIEDGVLTFTDRRNGQRWTAEDLDLAVSLPSLDAPASATGATRWNGRAVTLALSVEAPRALMDGRPTPVSLKLDGPLAASFDGTAAAGAAPSADGAFAVSTESVTDAAAWAGFPVAAPAGKDLGALNLNGRIAWPGALDADGRIVFGGTPVGVKLNVAKLNRMLADDASPVELTVAGQPLNLHFKGMARAGQKTRLDGGLALDVPSLRGLAAWVGQPLPDDLAPGKLGPLELKGMVTADSTRAGLSDLALRLDDIRLAGKIAAGWGGTRPSIEADLTAGALDLNPYLPPEAPAGSSAAAGGGGRAGPDGEAWSDEPIDVSGLHAADAKLSLAAESIAVRQFQLGQTQAALQVRNGRADLALKRVDAFGGRASGNLRLDASGQTLAVRHDLDAAGVKLLPLLRAVAGLDVLEGTGEARYALTAAGNSQRALVASLSGDGSLRAVDGAIVGVNIGAMLRNVTGAFTGQASSADAKTDFAELAGSFAIEQGLLKNGDLRMLAPLFRLSGAGTADLPRKTLSYRLEPKLAATAKGQGGAFDRSGLMVPVVVEGPWANLSFRPDLTAVKPEDVVGTVKDIGKDPKAAVKGLVGGLVGNKEQPAQEAAPAEQAAPSPAPASPLDVLRGLRQR